MKLLLAIDDSKHSQQAVDAVIAQANPKDTIIRVLHVIEPLTFYPDGQAWRYGVPNAVPADEQRGEAEGLVARTAQRLREAGFTVSTTVEIGNPKVVIVDVAAEWPADLIVVASHGRKGLDRLVIGSVSEAVARHAPCSVEIVRATAAKAA